MLRSFHLPLLGLALVAATASAQTTPTASSSAHRATTKKAAAPRQVSNTSAAARRADPLRGTNDNGKDQSGYAAPGQPIVTPNAGGKNTTNYDGQVTKPTKSNATLNTPK